ncbi:MAG: hypothetical protein OXC11_08615 [Rhodospirillales bacterium]|nr:hypothetical protein [Rhodospirillales bacterium]
MSGQDINTYPCFAVVDEDGREHFESRFHTFEEARAEAEKRYAEQQFGQAVCRYDGPTDDNHTHMWAVPADGFWPPVGFRVIDGKTYIDTSVEGAKA